MKNKDRKWLELVGMSGATGMYPGIQHDAIPSAPAARLEKEGLIELFFPHNSAHKDRWTVTPEGRAALSTRIPRPED